MLICNTEHTDPLAAVHPVAASILLESRLGFGAARRYGKRAARNFKKPSGFKAPCVARADLGRLLGPMLSRITTSLALSTTREDRESVFSMS